MHLTSKFGHAFLALVALLAASCAQPVSEQSEHHQLPQNAELRISTPAQQRQRVEVEKPSPAESSPKQIERAPWQPSPEALRGASSIYTGVRDELDAAKRELEFVYHPLFGLYVHGDEGPYRNFPAEMEMEHRGGSTRARQSELFQQKRDERVKDPHAHSANDLDLWDWSYPPPSDPDPYGQ